MPYGNRLLSKQRQHACLVYAPFVERADGFEPPIAVLQTAALNLLATPSSFLAEQEGIEPSLPI